MIRAVATTPATPTMVIVVAVAETAVFQDLISEPNKECSEEHHLRQYLVSVGM